MMRILIGSDNAEESQIVCGVMTRSGLDCPSGLVVPLDTCADRAIRVLPELLVLVWPADSRRGFECLRDVRATLPGTHILVTGPVTDAKLILQVLHEGADEFLDRADLDRDLGESLVRMRGRDKLAVTPETAGKVIAVLGAGGGTGASTLAASLAVSLAAAHRECAAVDLRLRAGDLAPMFDMQPPRSLADVCDHLSRFDYSMLEQVFAKHQSGVWLLPAPVTTAGIGRVSGRGVRRALGMARLRFPYVVVDMDNSFEEEQVEALWLADVILLLIRLDFTSVRNARRILDSLAEYGISLDAVQLAVSGYRERKQLRVAQAEAALGMPVRHYLPNDPAAANLSVNKGVPVALFKPWAKLSRSIRSLAACVNGRDAAH